MKRNPSLFFGFLPVLLLFAVVLGEHLFPSSTRVYEPHFLLPLLNTSLFLAAGVVAYIAMRIYLISGSPTILWIGCGVLTLGTGSLAAGWLIRPFGPNVNVTIFNMGVFLASICHIGAAVANLGARPGEADPTRRKRNVRIGYLAVLLGIALLVVLTITGLTPPFFIQGQGPTVIRQNVAGWAIVLLIVSSLFTISRFFRKRASFLYWYSLALALLALAMLAFLLQPAVGSPIGWMGRSAYVLAGIYFLVSVSSGLREARRGEANLSKAVAELFGLGLHWQEILATVSDAIVAYDDRGKFLLWNMAAERIFGYPEAEVVGKGLDLILPDKQAIEASGRNGAVTEIELGRQDGSRFNAEISVSAKRSSLGVITTLVIRDITERIRAEEVLREREAKYRAAIETSADGFCISDMAGRFLEFNDAFAGLLGYSRKELLSMSVPDIEAQITPAEIAATIEKVRREGHAAFETKHRSKEGRVWPVEVNLGYWPIAGGRLFVFVRDITERKQAEEALRESEEHYRSLFNNMLNGFAYCRMHFEQDRPVDFTYLEVNDTFEDLTGLKDVVGKKVSEVIPGIRESDPELLEIYGRVALTGIPERFESYVKALGMWFSISVYSPQKEYFVVIFDVITERKLAEEALRRLNEELEQRVKERTAELSAANEQLLREVEDRQLAEQQAESIGRLYRLLSKVNEAIVRGQEPEWLFRRACRIMMEEGDFLLCWIGRVDWEAGLVRAAAQYDLVDDYPQTITIAMEDVPEGRGPTGVAVREGRWDVCLDIANDPRMAP